MQIGMNIKKLRRKRDLTQEELADALGVTPKAVSAWECDRSAPDLSLIPLLCRIFDVTADTLLGIDIEQKAEEVQKIVDHAYELMRYGNYEEAHIYLKDARKQYPMDEELASTYCCTIPVVRRSNDRTEEEKNALLKEGIALCEKIHAESTNDHHRQAAIADLCTYYCEIGEKKKAEELALSMPILVHSRPFLFINIAQGTEYWQRSKGLMQFDLLQFFVRQFAYNYKLDSGETVYTYDEINTLREKKIKLLELLFENGDLGYYHEECASTHIYVAMYYAKKKQFDKTYSHLHFTATHTLAFLDYTRTDQYKHTSLLFRDIMRDGTNSIFYTNNDNLATEMLSHLKKNCFDCIRHEEEFQKIEKELSDHAGRYND